MTVPQFVLYIATSLDGYIARPDGRIDWLPAIDPMVEDYGYNAFYETIDALVMGASTYEQVLSFGEWPYPGKPTYVLTRRSRTSSQPEVVFVQDGMAALQHQINQANYRRVWVVGGGQIVSAFLQQDLLDEFIITVMPILLGAGIPLFQSIPERQLQLVQSRAFAFGAVELIYRRATP